MGAPYIVGDSTSDSIAWTTINPGGWAQALTVNDESEVVWDEEDEEGEDDICDCGDSDCKDYNPPPEVLVTEDVDWW